MIRAFQKGVILMNHHHSVSTMIAVTLRPQGIFVRNYKNCAPTVSLAG
jgi:hypothetical protein